MSQPLSETHSANGVGQNVTTAAGQHRKKHTKRAQRELPHGAPGPRSPPLPQRGASRSLRGRGRAGAGPGQAEHPAAAPRPPTGTPRAAPRSFAFSFPSRRSGTASTGPPAPQSAVGARCQPPAPSGGLRPPPAPHGRPPPRPTAARTRRAAPGSSARCRRRGGSARGRR